MGLHKWCSVFQIKFVTLSVKVIDSQLNSVTLLLGLAVGTRHVDSLHTTGRHMDIRPTIDATR